jgi:hypothetical protein
MSPGMGRGPVEAAVPSPRPTTERPQHRASLHERSEGRALRALQLATRSGPQRPRDAGAAFLSLLIACDGSMAILLHSRRRRATVAVKSMLLEGSLPHSARQNWRLYSMMRGGSDGPSFVSRMRQAGC